MKKVISIIAVLALSLMILTSCGVAKIPNIGKIIDAQKTMQTESDNGEAGRPDEKETTADVDPGGKQTQATKAPAGKLKAWESYEAYLEQKSELVTLAMEAAGSNEETAFEAFNLMGMLAIDFIMFPAALLGQDEDVVRSTFNMMGNTGLKYSVKGNEYVMEWEDDDGDTTRFTTVFDPAKEAMYSKVELGDDEDETIFYDYIRTSYGYFAQIINQSEDDGGFAAFTQISIDENGGVIGISNEKVEYKKLNGNELRDLPRSLPQWYDVEGDNFSMVNEEGEAYSFQFEPPTDD